MDSFLPENEANAMDNENVNAKNMGFRLAKMGTEAKPQQTNMDNFFHKSVRPLTNVARYIALFPLLGINAENVSDLYFNWFTKVTLYSIVSLMVLLLFDVLIIVHAVNIGLNYGNTVQFSYFVSYTCSRFLFLHLATKWPKFACEWEKLEKCVRPFNQPSHLAMKCKLITYTIMTFATIEIISTITTDIYESLVCFPESTDVVRTYFNYTYPYFFAFVTYNTTSVIFLTIFQILFILCWHFVDIVIIVLSIAMSDHYKMFNETLHSVKDRITPPAFWRTMRETYNYLSILTRLLDDLLSPIVFLSFANNLYFICLQLFNSLKPMASTWHAIHFVYSFTYLVLRTTMLSLFAAAIHDHSKKPKAALFCVPSESYCNEASRLLNQVIFDDLALTGCRFFSVTRTLVLTIAGTIVTYEIVLVQFNSSGGYEKYNITGICQTEFN